MRDEYIRVGTIYNVHTFAYKFNDATVLYIYINRSIDASDSVNWIIRDYVLYNANACCPPQKTIYLRHDAAFCIYELFVKLSPSLQMAAPMRRYNQSC